MYDMKSVVTIRLDEELQRLLDRVCKETGRSRSDIVRDALRRQLMLLRFEQLRKKILPFAHEACQCALAFGHAGRHARQRCSSFRAGPPLHSLEHLKPKGVSG